MKNNTYIILGLALFSLWGHSQKRDIRKANKDYTTYAYAEAIDSYEALIAAGHSESSVYRNLANANYFNAKYGEAANWYAKLFEDPSEGLPAELMYRYAQSLRSEEDYNAAQAWMEKFSNAAPQDSRAIKWKKDKAYRQDIASNTAAYTIQNLDFNSSYSDFAPAYWGDRIVFASARDTGLTRRHLHAWNKKPFLNLYATNAKKELGGKGGTQPLLGDINQKTHESSPVFSKDGNTVYFTRNHSVNGRLKHDNKGVSRLQLFRARLKNGEWRDVTPLPFNSRTYSVAHPALSPDGKTLYFSSDMPGSIGNSDIYAVAILADGSFGTPENLGPEINTEGREGFPFITNSNILYFSSDGHQGLGGLDIFACDLKNEDGQTIVHAGVPLNGPQDDFALIMDPSEQRGLFSSNRKGGKGEDDIYGFMVTTPLSFEEVHAEEQPDPILLVAEDESPSTTDIPEKGTDLMAHLGLRPILFEFDRYAITPEAARTLQKIAAYLKDRPQIAVAIYSHTDTRGPRTYNQILSQKRAQSTMVHLIGLGVEKTRLTATGLGEEHPLLPCGDLPCKKQVHKKNRRSEFKVQ